MGRAVSAQLAAWPEASQHWYLVCRARVGLGPEANNVEGGLKSGACQHQCPWGRMSSPEWPPPVSVFTGWAARSLQDQQVGLTKASFKLLLLPWGQECKISCAPFKSEVSISSSPLKVSPPPALLKVSPAGLQSQMLWGLIFPVQDPWAGKCNTGLRPLTPLEEPLQ